MICWPYVALQTAVLLVFVGSAWVGSVVVLVGSGSFWAVWAGILVGQLHIGIGAFFGLALCLDGFVPSSRFCVELELGFFGFKLDLLGLGRDDASTNFC